MNETKLDKISDNIESIKDDIGLIKIDLAVHMSRTAANEEMLQLLRKDLKPVEIHVERVNGALKLLGATGIIVTVVTILYRVVTYGATF